MPRAEPTRHDATALVFLDAAAELIDAALAERGPLRPARLRSLRFPPALDWIRVEDILGMARSRSEGPTLSKKAFTNRWPSKDAFIRDAIVHCMLYRDEPSRDPRSLGQAAAFVAADAKSFSAEILAAADALYSGLLDHPRTYLLAHIGPMLGHHPDLQAEVQASSREALRIWVAGYAEVLRAADLEFRPGWTLDRVSLALQSMVDGFVLRHRIDPQAMSNARWGTASLFADTVVAFIAGALDPERTGLSTYAWLDQSITRIGRSGFVW